ncbi:uncharacterized protein N7511_001165 [Penicillium nucicola]|uniref:uncharacterized protein n=1 Tax=Penicillium nucicola TaxID=1850975 RepID=UPI002545B8D7|nr:uncharacterized protein N7511_001165 [Penicillium nucicola]KAJ5776154.1 hypothetical protein N7511_001165 [Penicillium nucicola]
MTTTTSPHIPFMKKCLSLAEQSPPRPTNFRVGALLLSRKDNDPTFADDRILSTGYTMELAGNTHAEQCCFSNYAAVHNVPDDLVSTVLPVETGRKLIMYVTMEPCGKRLSGNAPCAQRIARTTEGGKAGIHKVYFGVKEPETFVGESEGCRMLTEAGIEWEHVSGLERDILSVAFAGHENGEEEVRIALGEKGTNIDDISPEERRRQEEAPRNPKKRMMEGQLHPRAATVQYPKSTPQGQYTKDKDDPMATGTNVDLTFYPAFCFKASPTHFTWVKMSAADVHHLRRAKQFVGQDTFFYNNHPIRFVSLVGLIVARTEITRRTILTLDDSSDKESIDITPLQPGTIIRIKGTLSMFRQRMQINLERFMPVPDTNSEMGFLDQRLRFLIEVLSVPWVLSDDEIEKCRVDAEKGDVRALEERRRVERRGVKRREREERDALIIAKRYEREEKEREKEGVFCREDGVRVMRRFGWEGNGCDLE